MRFGFIALLLIFLASANTAWADTEFPEDPFAKFFTQVELKMPKNEVLAWARWFGIDLRILNGDFYRFQTLDNKEWESTLSFVINIIFDDERVICATYSIMEKTVLDHKQKGECPK